MCSHGHSFDVAREGYVTLFEAGVGHAFGDDVRMVASRADVEQAGHLEPLTAALVQTAGRFAGADTSLVLDIGAGTGHHLAGVLGSLPQARGVALDASRPAARCAGRAHESIAAVRADVWRQIPLADRAVDLALNVFAPRNGAELARVVRPGGTMLSVTPTSAHLHELATLHSIRVDPNKPTRLRRALNPWFQAISVWPITWTLRLSRAQAAAVLRMGPAARHLQPDFDSRLATLGEPIPVTGAVQLRAFRRRA
jgi:SAM-dependent methyltransferase